jgi:hypothetical protein
MHMDVGTSSAKARGEGAKVASPLEFSPAKCPTGGGGAPTSPQPLESQYHAGNFAHLGLGLPSQRLGLCPREHSPVSTQ